MISLFEKCCVYRRFCTILLIVVMLLVGCTFDEGAAVTDTNDTDDGTEAVSLVEISEPDRMTALPQIVSVTQMEDFSEPGMLCYHIAYRSDDLTRYAIMLLPADYRESNYPTLLYYPLLMTTEQRLAELFGGMDMIVLYILPRTYQNEGAETLLSADDADLEVLLDICRQSDFLSRGGIAVSGSSDNCVPMMRLARRRGEELLGVIAVDGYMDLAELYETDCHDHKAELAALLSAPLSEAPALYDEYSPLSFVEDIQIPVLLLTYDDADGVITRQNERMRDALLANGMSCDLVSLEPQYYDFNGEAVVSAADFVHALSAEYTGIPEAVLDFLDASAEQPVDPYYIFVYNSNRMSEEDLTALDRMEQFYTDIDIHRMDAAEIPNELALYNALREHRDTAAGTLVGIQILGDTAAVPSFVSNFRYRYKSGVDEGYAVTDYFYTNLDNNPSKLLMFNVCDHFEKEKQVDLFPQYEVARLPLQRDKYTAYVENYENYLSWIKENAIQTVSAASPIFSYGFNPASIDDVSYFLNRAEEWDLVDDVHLYTNQENAFPVLYDVLGDSAADVWTKESDRAVCEYYICGHGNFDRFLKTIISEDYSATTAEIMTTQDINTYLDGYPYFMNITNCLTAGDMRSSIVNTALQGSCIGAFASTSTISNVEVSAFDRRISIENGYTYFSIYYHYLNARREGLSRSKAFLIGQQHAAYALENHTAQQEYWQYEPSCHNLLFWQNVGILSPE